jgi:hypothetical protein
MQHLEGSGTPVLYIEDARFLKVNLFNILKVVPISDYVRQILLETNR